MKTGDAIDTDKTTKVTEPTTNKFYTLAISRQRNFFVGCMVLLLVSNLYLALKLSAISEKTIMVPGINQEMSIEDGIVSSSYLEETSLLFSSVLLDLTPDTIDLKKRIILKHTSNQSPKSIQSIQEYFANASTEHKKFQLSTFFSPKHLHVDNRELQVVIEGLLSSSFGKRGFEQHNVKYLMSFDYIGGALQIKEFVELKSEVDLLELIPRSNSIKTDLKEIGTKDV